MYVIGVTIVPALRWTFSWKLSKRQKKFSIYLNDYYELIFLVIKIVSKQCNFYFRSLETQKEVLVEKLTLVL